MSDFQIVPFRCLSKQQKNRFYERKDCRRDLRQKLYAKYIDKTDPKFSKLTREQLTTSVARLVSPLR